MGIIQSLLTNLALALERIAGIALIGIAIIVTSDVLTRWFTGSPIVGVFEISSVMLVAVTLLAVPGLLLRQKQLRVDIAFEHAGPAVKRAIVVFDAVVGFGLLATLCRLAVVETDSAYFGGYLINGMIALPKWIPFLMIALGSGLGALVLLLHAVGAVSGRAISVPDFDKPVDKEKR